MKRFGYHLSSLEDSQMSQDYRDFLLKHFRTLGEKITLLVSPGGEEVSWGLHRILTEGRRESFTQENPVYSHLDIASGIVLDDLKFVWLVETQSGLAPSPISWFFVPAD